MSRPAVIVDTNVVVAALLTAHDDSPVARILHGMLVAAFPFVVSEALLAEYRTVLVRPNLRKLHVLTVAEVEALLTDLAQHAIVLAPEPSPAASEPGDELLWDLLAARAGLVLVTGDKLLRKDARMRARAISPRAFVTSV